MRCRLASRGLAAISSIVPCLKNDLKDKLIQQVPKWALDPAQVSLETLQEMDKEFTQILKVRGKGAELSYTLDDIMREKKAAAESAALVSQMLATCRNTLQK